MNRGILDAHRRGIVTSATLLVGARWAEAGAHAASREPRLGLGLHLEFPGEADAATLLQAAGEQLDRFRVLVGRPPTHLDVHHHAHRRPEVLDAVARLAAGHGLPVRSLDASMRGRLRGQDIRTPDVFLDAFHAEGATLETLLGLVAGLAPGASELMCHPGFVDDALRDGSRYAEPREAERTALTDARVRAALRERGVETIHYGQL